MEEFPFVCVIIAFLARQPYARYGRWRFVDVHRRRRERGGVSSEIAHGDDLCNPPALSREDKRTRRRGRADAGQTVGGGKSNRDSAIVSPSRSGPRRR